MATLEGSIERITYRSEETGYTVARLQPSGKRHLVTVVGKLLGVQVGESLRLEGEWTSHPEHGRQFAAAGWQSVLPTDVEGIRKYLGSGLIKGIGPVMAERIVQTFGAETLRVIEGDPRRLSEVPGLGGKKIDAILKAWNEQQGIKALMALLQSRGITPSLAIRIYRQYGEAALSIIDTSPYRLADEVVGVGFTTADQVALGQGVRHDDPFRIGAGLRHALHEAAADGHCYLPAEQLVDRATRLLDVDPALVEATLRNSDAAGEVHLDEVDGERHVYLLPF
ncbi:MAG TPA: ATP-dependent RecD-like DNA helicase, partial [Herpetosiphonaceae bacterium]|nr:ATP-dependent RecD-like DNA helicase [Herpetosiphonaceae bacterium]